MSTDEQTPLSQPTFAVRNTLGKEQAPQNLVRPVSDEKKPQGKVGTQVCPNQVRKPGTEARSFQITEGERSGKKNGVQKIEKGTHKATTKVLALKKHKLLLRNIATKESIREERKQCQKVKEVHEGTGSQNQRSKSRIRMPSHIKTNYGSEDPEDHLKLFQAAAKTERWAMPTWCHMFNSTLTENARVWFDDLPKESIDSYDDLRKAFLENYLQQKKCIKDPVEIHNIKQRNGESTEEFVRSWFFVVGLGGEGSGSVVEVVERAVKQGGGGKTVGGK
nr:reverse transcriptase domain-containing protein [Tanacetum cinerariifolium]